MSHDIASRLLPRHLRLILAIVGEGQLGGAAQRLNMTQPAASRMLLEVERIVGAPLFARHPKGMRITAMGEILSRRATGLVSGLDEAMREIDAFKAGQIGSVRIGAVTGAAVGVAVPAIQALKREAPGAEIHVDVGPSDTLIDGLLAGDFDFVLGRPPHGIDTRQFEILRGRVENVSFQARAAHPLAGRAGLSLHDIAGFPMVVQARGTPLRRGLEEAFLANEIAMPVDIVNTTSLVVMIAFLTSTDAIAPMSNEVSELLGLGVTRAALTQLAVRETIVLSPYHLITRRGRPLSPLTARLRELVLDALGR
ncbi:MAG: DNA-binding transcriptional LysR family regulator [Paracoccaceae bacterium]|jgi:DNA-binding transcriptional LysR family regulator